MLELKPDDLKRFWENVDRTQPDGCWPWLGPRDKDGYGIFGLAGKKLKAHRISCELHHGDLPGGVPVLHECDNPPCVQPRHLSAGTQKANALDRALKGRSARHAGTANGRAKLNEVQVLEIRRLCEVGQLTQRAIGRRFGVTDVLVSKIARRQLWQHLEG